MSDADVYKRVLVVEDEATLRGLVAEALRESGWVVQTAANGVEALDVLHRWMPNVILLDLMMPRLDGAGFTHLMRLNPRLANIPVVLVTAAHQPVDAGVRVGAHAVLSKPFELEQLVDTISRVAGVPPPLPMKLRPTNARRSGESVPPAAGE